MEKCEESFPNVSLPVILSEFSVPSSLGDHKDVLGLPQQQVREREREGECVRACVTMIIISIPIELMII